ncbi:MAG: rhodanese-like domain-containing protein, partial [Balneolales bacterium]
TEDNFVRFILEGQPEPPLYFARMKRDNKKGPAIVGGPPSPKHIKAQELADLAQKKRNAVLDTRLEPDFIAGHFKGTLLTTMNKQFNTIAGSFVAEDENIYLIVDEHKVKEAVTDLYRVGLDNIKGYITFEDLNQYVDQGGKLDSIESIDFEEAVKRSHEKNHILDVRKRSEYENEGHLKSAQNVAHTRLPEKLKEIPRDKPVIVHCAAGARSAASAAFLKREGYDVSVVMDSFAKYKEKSLGVV